MWVQLKIVGPTVWRETALVGQTWVTFSESSETSAVIELKWLSLVAGLTVVHGDYLCLSECQLPNYISNLWDMDAHIQTALEQWHLRCTKLQSEGCGPMKNVLSAVMMTDLVSALETPAKSS